MDLVVEQLECERGGRPVFSDLSFRAAAGHALLIRGPNGAGKSTLLRVLAGLLQPGGGSVHLGAYSLADRNAFQEYVAYAGHQDAVKPTLSVAENLMLWAGVFGTVASRADAALTRFGLDTIADRPGAQCSAGQKRRLGLARLMVTDRPLWLLDEPTVSLDKCSAAMVAELIRAHCAGGGIALVATHIDLGLGHTPILEMQPPERAGHRDSFLDGDWA